MGEQMKRWKNLFRETSSMKDLNRNSRTEN